MRKYLAPALALSLLAAPVLAAPPTRAELDAERAALFAEADADSSGGLTAAEFANFLELSRAKHEERLFNDLDTNADGVVTKAELTAAAASFRGHRPGGPPPM
jgi:Ca2+-binding EF-hand superfamily protein